MKCRLLPAESSDIIKVIDWGEHNGPMFYVMELAEGRTLRELMANRLPIERVLSITREVLIGLKAAHAAGMIDRDLSRTTSC